MVVTGQATAGLIWSKLSFQRSVSVRVWRPLALGARRIKSITPGGKLCRAEFELNPGRHYSLGVESEAKVERIPNLRFLGVQFRGTQQYKTYEVGDKPGKEVATLEWRTAELSPMRAETFTLIMQTDAKVGKTRDEWEAVLQAIQCTFSEAH